MSLNKKILIAIVPIFSLSMAGYLAYEIFQTQAAYQKDFDTSIKTSITILAPALANDIYDLDTGDAQRALKGIFANSNIEKAIVYGDDKKFFTGAQKLKEKSISQLHHAENLQQYIKDFRIENSHEFLISSLSLDERRYIYPLRIMIGADKEESFHGVLIIDASTQALKERIFNMIFRLIAGLIFSLVVAVVFSRLLLQFQIVKPIVRLMQASLDISKGKFTKLPDIKNGASDEIAMLTHNFNLMALKIERNLNFIRGMAKASQEIVKCKELNEILKSLSEHVSHLINAQEVELWLTPLAHPQADSIHLQNVGNINNLLSIQEPLFKAIYQARDTVFLSSLEKAEKFAAQIGAPLITKQGFFVGIIIVSLADGFQSYEEECLQVANGLSVAVMTAIENYWRIEQEKNKANIERDLELASALQDSIVSKTIPIKPYYDAATYYRAAEKCGGDWFGCYDLGDKKLLILFGDVSGHGTAAALITAVTKGSADMLKYFILSDEHTVESIPSRTLGYLNECLFHAGKQMYFMTMAAAVIDFSAQKIYASSAGHTPPALISQKEGKAHVSFIHLTGGNLLGFAENSQYESMTLDFVSGEQLVFYTDGLVDGTNKENKKLGLRKFKTFLEQHAHLSSNLLIEKICENAFEYFDGVDPADDIAILALKFK